MAQPARRGRAPARPARQSGERHPGADPAVVAGLADRVRALDVRGLDLQERLADDPVVARYNEPTAPGIADRISRVVSAVWGSRTAPIGT